jgi:hypothetical protein
MKRAIQWSLVVVSVIPAVASSSTASATIGYSSDFLAAVASGTISSATGTFPVVTNVTTVNGGGNAYSIQLNTNQGVDPSPNHGLCAGAHDPSICTEWEQFVYNSNGTLYIQYWLKLYNNDSNCPINFMPDGQEGCFYFPPAIAAPIVPVANLQMVKMVASAGGGTDTLQFWYGSNLTTYTHASVFPLSSWWKQAEFNVFGSCCNVTAAFDGSNTVIVTSLSINSGTSSAPTCFKGGIDGEANNLSLVTGSCCPMSGTPSTAPGIMFSEAMNSSAAFPYCFLSDVTSMLFPLM